MDEWQTKTYREIALLWYLWRVTLLSSPRRRTNGGFPSKILSLINICITYFGFCPSSSWLRPFIIFAQLGREEGEDEEGHSSRNGALFSPYWYYIYYWLNVGDDGAVIKPCHDSVLWNFLLVVIHGSVKEPRISSSHLIKYVCQGVDECLVHCRQMWIQC